MSKFSLISLCGYKKMKIKFQVCHVTLVSYIVLIGFIHIWVTVLRTLLTTYSRDSGFPKPVVRDTFT